MTKPFNISLD